MNKFEQGDLDWLQGILTGQQDNMLSHGRTERIVNHITELRTYVDHQPHCIRATIHRAYFTDKYPCDCGFDDLGIELKFKPVKPRDWD
jgi:hypothetical protein